MLLDVEFIELHEHGIQMMRLNISDKIRVSNQLYFLSTMWPFTLAVSCWHCHAVMIPSCRKWGFKCLLLRLNSAKAYMCKQATGSSSEHTRLKRFIVVTDKTPITIICVTAGSSISRYWGYLEPWRELISIIWFLWYGYCMEEIKVWLKQTCTEIQVSSHTRLCRLFA